MNIQTKAFCLFVFTCLLLQKLKELDIIKRTSLLQQISAVILFTVAFPEYQTGPYR